MRLLLLCVTVGICSQSLFASDPITIEALSEALKSSEVSTRRAAALKLGQIRAYSDEALEALGRATQDKDLIVASRAIKSLSYGFRNRDRQLEILLDVMKADNATVRIAALETLSRWNRPAERLLSVYLKAIKEDNAAIRSHAARGIARLDLRKLPNAKAQILVAMEPLIQSEDYKVQLAGASVLGYHQLDADAALPVLIKLLDGPDRQTRREALTAIERFGELGKPAIEALLQHMESGDDHHRRTVGRSILRIDPENGVSLLSDVLKKSRSQHARAAVVEGLATLLDSEDAYRSLVMALKDRSGNVRYYACMALRNFKKLDEEAVSNLRDVIQRDRSSIVRSTAKGTLEIFQ